jgi:cation:H+ antiporter
LNWISGLALLAALAAMLFHAAAMASRHRKANVEEEIEGADPNLGWGKIALFLGLGIIGLPLGANLLVEGSTNVARAYGVSETVIGLTLVAIGTSLPELATTVMAALRRQADVALGNVIGSNMFNVLGIMGVASLVGEIPVAPEVMTFDIWVMLAASLLLIPFVFLKRDITRIWGAILSVLYVTYLVVVLA